MNSVKVITDFETALLSARTERLPRTILDIRPSKDEERAAILALRRLHGRTLVYRALDSPREFCFKDVADLYLEGYRSECPEYVVELLNYLRLYQAVAGLIRSLEFNSAEVWFAGGAVPCAAEQLLASVADLPAFDENLLSSKLILGKLQALKSRKVAATTFAASREALKRHIHLFLGELGATTYFAEDELIRNRELIGTRRASLAERITYGEISAADTQIILLMSCERRFFEVYLPYWLSVADYLKAQGVAFHFLLTEPPEHASLLIERAGDLTRTLASFRRKDVTYFCNNVSFSSVAVPQWCASRRVFAACARYLYARPISEQTGLPIVIQDIDFSFTDDPTPWLQALPPEKLALKPNRVKWSIDPWRKFLGGLCSLPSSSRVFGAMKQLEDYVIYGLDEPESWHLDQNALSYLYDSESSVEGSGQGAPGCLSSLTDLRPLGQPLSGAPVNGLWEASHDDG